MIKVDCNYNIADDIGFIIEAEHINKNEFAEEANISRTTLDEIIKNNITSKNIYEKIYSFIYSKKYRINSVKRRVN